MIISSNLIILMDLNNARKSTTQVNVTITNDPESNNRTMTRVNINKTTRQPTFKYTIDQQLEVRKRVNNDVHLRRLNPDTCKVIRKLRLNRKGKITQDQAVATRNSLSNP